MAAGFKTAQVNASLVPSTQTNFPSYVDLSRLGITTLAEAQSVRVYADSAKTTEWAREIVSATEMHVKVPSLTSTVEIYVDWDGIRADYAVTDTYGRNAVWSDYAAVYHFETLVTDYSGNSRTLTNKNSVALGSGQLGAGADFGSANTTKNFYTTPSQLTYAQLASGFCVSQWVRPESLASNNRVMRYILNNGSQERNFILDINTAGKVNQNFFSGTSKNNTGATTLSVNNWYHIHNIYDGGMKVFVNGALDASDTWTWGGFTRNTLSCMALGAEQLTTGGASSEFLKGEVDEVRFSVNSNHFSANWITTEYNNQNDEADFWGTWADAGSGASPSRLMMMGVGA